jgi:hypothetical protein
MFACLWLPMLLVDDLTMLYYISILGLEKEHSGLAGHFA